MRQSKGGFVVNELIKVQYKDNSPIVSGRELHEYLGVGTEYAKWFDRMCEYGFSEGVDFSSILTESTGGRPATDHALTIPMAKEICMVQRNEKGKLARQYFISLEQAWNSPEQVMARALKLADQKILSLQTENEIMKPKALFADAVSSSKDSVLIGNLATILKQNGINTGQKRLFAWLRENGYLKKNTEDKNMPTYKGMHLGLFEVKKSTGIAPSGEVKVRSTTKVTCKGQQYFINKFLNKEVSA